LAPGRLLIACRYPTVEAATSSFARLSRYFAVRQAGTIATMRCVGSSGNGVAHIVAAAGFRADAGVLASAPWGEGSERCEDDVPDLIARRLYARVARNAAAGG
jgi:hypothetical protein